MDPNIQCVDGLTQKSYRVDDYTYSICAREGRLRADKGQRTCRKHYARRTYIASPDSVLRLEKETCMCTKNKTCICKGNLLFRIETVIKRCLSYSTGAYICTYIYIHTYIYIYTRIHIYTYVCMYVHQHIYIYIYRYIYICTCIFVFIYVYVYIYVYIYVYMYAYIYIYIYTHIRICIYMYV